MYCLRFILSGLLQWLDKNCFTVLKNKSMQIEKEIFFHWELLLHIALPDHTLCTGLYSSCMFLKIIIIKIVTCT